MLLVSQHIADFKVFFPPYYHPLLWVGWEELSHPAVSVPAWPREQEGNTRQVWLLVLHWVLESLGSEMSVPAVGPSGANKINLV